MRRVEDPWPWKHCHVHIPIPEGYLLEYLFIHISLTVVIEAVPPFLYEPGRGFMVLKHVVQFSFWNIKTLGIVMEF